MHYNTLWESKNSTRVHKENENISLHFESGISSTRSRINWQHSTKTWTSSLLLSNGICFTVLFVTTKLSLNRNKPKFSTWRYTLENYKTTNEATDWKSINIIHASTRYAFMHVCKAWTHLCMPSLQVILHNAKECLKVINLTYHIGKCIIQELKCGVEYWLFRHYSF